MASIAVEFVAPFIQATQETFETMVGLTVRRRDAWVKDGYTVYGEISGVIGLSGATAGTCAISMPLSMAVHAVGAMLDETLEPDSSQGVVRDGVGELINMIAGRAKALLSKTPYKFDITLPTIVSGGRHEVFQRKGTRCLVLLFETETHARFSLEICVAEKKIRSKP